MKLRLYIGLSAVLLSIFCLLVLGQKAQRMSVTGIEYRKKNTDAPYRVDGQTLPPQATLYYQLDCKKGAAGLHVGNSYEIEEGTDEDGMKVLSIYYQTPNKPVTKPTVIGIACSVVSVKAKQ